VKFLDALNHYCIDNAVLHIHPAPTVHQCAACGLTLAEDNFVKFSQNGTCPKCGVAMTSSGPQKFGELHAELCVDETKHYPEKLASGELSSDDYTAWVATLTDREKMGFYERVRSVHLHVQFNHAEIALQDSNPEAFQKLVDTKLRARAELTLQHDHQHRYTTEQRRAEHLTQHFKK
jgi:predicted RNA-binding Zn-ribbon protein involved in translation (DUF1610 family)